jgi:crotonobetainyl-CoA:carnitine CoA-transferase CaiB-like acyl-CoA transferase
MAFLSDPDNRRRRLTVRFDHADFGRFDHIGDFWDFGDLAVRLDAPPPLHGEHTVEILTQRGFTPARIDALIATGAVKAA